MIDRLLSTEMMDLVQRSMDAAALSHKVLSNNIANVDTPGFKRSEVIFSEELKKALQDRQGQGSTLSLARTDPRHLQAGANRGLGEIEARIETDPSGSLRNDGNNVDIDREVSLLAQNTVWYQTLAQITQQQYGQILTAVTDGQK